MSKLNINRLTNENEDGAPKITGISTFSSNAFVEVPKGSTAERPEYVSPGMIRFNTDSGHLEYYNGVEWTEVLVANNTLDGGARGVIASAYSPSILNVLEYITISTLGNAQDFGDTTLARHALGSCASSTRGLFGGGEKSNAPSPGTSFTNTIDYITISSTGDAIDFGDLNSATRAYPRALSSSTRGVFSGGLNPALTNQIDYVTISSTGDAQDFGDLTEPKQRHATASSSTRGINAGGLIVAAPTATNVIEYITISTTGNGQDFGDLGVANFQLSGCSNSTRGVFGGGFQPTLSNVIQFITIASLGNSQDFGDLSQNKGYIHSMSSQTRGIFAGGLTVPSPPTNVIEYVTILTTGNAVDFGDQINASGDGSACSNAHGGL